MCRSRGKIKHRLSSRYPAFTDRKDVILLALNKLESLFIKTKQLTDIVVSGDFKVYKLLCEINMDYGKKMDWLLPYLGEMHVLMNYLAGDLGRHWYAGVKEVMGEVYKNKMLGRYTHTANATMLFSEACVRLFLESFMSSESSSIVHAIKTRLAEGANELAKSEDKQNFFTKCKEAEEFIHPLLEELGRFVQKESAGNKTFASWVSLINNELVPFIALAVAGRTGNWKLRNAALKAMTPVLTLFGLGGGGGGRWPSGGFLPNISKTI